jgi:RNA polymerase primary sigma factor
MRPIGPIDKIPRTRRQTLDEAAREPAPGEIADKLGLPRENVRKVLKIVRKPISFATSAMRA